MLELGVWIRPSTGSDVLGALAAEHEGFDIALYGDSQNMYPDPFVRLGMAAARTERIRLATGVTNPVTRDPAVTAAAIAGVHAETGGRAILGIGSGDSALGYIGKSYPAPFAVFSSFVHQVRTYLHGGLVDREGYESRLHWLPSDLPPVPVDVSCTGPRSIRFAAQNVDRVSFTVGASSERISWALETARAGLALTGRSPEDVQFGAWLVVGVADDHTEACEALRSTVSVLGHFSGMEGSKIEQLPPIMRRAAIKLRDAFEDQNGGDRNDPSYMQTVAATLDDEFVDWFAAVGSPEQVVKRLRSLSALGLQHLYLVFGSPSTDRAFELASRARFLREVMPALRS